MTKNSEVLLASRPSGMSDLSNFSIREAKMPAPKEGEVLLKTLYLSVDPYMRGRMRDAPYFVEPFQINQPLSGGIVAEVVESKSPDLKKGDIVQGMLPWSNYSVSATKELQKVDPKLGPVSTALGVLGMPGMTAYFGLLEDGKPKKGETVVVTSAAGAVGSIVGQIAKIQGCRVVGVVGSDEKASFITKEFGFDAAINYKKPNYFEDLKKACPNGVDVFFDNVGGEISDRIFQLINEHARVVVCGQISQYNTDKPDMGPRLLWTILTKTATVKGFMVFDYSDERYNKGVLQMADWIKQGKIKYKENIISGIENAPKAFIGLFKGENIGKQLVKA